MIVSLVTMVLLGCATGARKCELVWLAGSRVEPSSLSPFVWKVPQTTGCGCDNYTTFLMDFTNWASEQPDNSGDTTDVHEACVAMASGNSLTSGAWYDANCNQRMCAICELNDDDKSPDHEHH